MNEVKLHTHSVFTLFVIAIFSTVFGVVLFTGAMIAFRPEPCKPDLVDLEIPTADERLYSNIQSPPINKAALNEIKYQGKCPNCPNCPPGCPECPVGCTCGCAMNDIKQQICPTCPPNRILPSRRVTVQPYYVVPSRPVPSQPTQPTQPSRPVEPYTPTPVIKPSTPVPTATTSTKPQIALFLDGSAKSTLLAEWFMRDQNLLALRRNCTFETYTTDNDLYRTRYSKIVPPNQFPAVLFQYSDGGHIHAAGKNMIPNTAAELYSDLKLGYEKAQSVRTAKFATTTGVVKSTGYSWDQEITPSMQLQDCPDGQCPVPETSWRPGDRVRDLFNDVQDNRSLMMWASATELITYGMFAVVVLLAFAVVLSRLGKK